MMHFPKKTTLLALSAILLGNCTTPSNIETRIRTAKQIASNSRLQPKTIETPHFTFTVYERVTRKDATLSVYIEGDGFAWLNRRRPSKNPTPINPVALRLASHDKVSENIMYMARPCQYTPITETAPCSSKYWTSKRFAPEVIKSFNEAINQTKQAYNISSLDLIGFSGGATIATLLAEERSDVRSLRTVAGNLDIDKFSDIHNVSKMPKSLNPADKAYKTRNIPQIHFTGENDRTAPALIFESYKEKIGLSRCMRHKIVPDVDHQNGWDALWPKLISITPKCGN